ncbi:MAG: pseudouridine synthase [Planctomycetes bacterium]|nr:pseudouridine synthase [Planctomycetota bacterium]
MGTLIRLQKILAQAGFGSRRSCEQFVLDGRVSVDGVAVAELGAKADPETQTVTLDGQKVAGPGPEAKSLRQQHEKVYWILNKPAGVLCTNQDPSGRPLAVQMVPEKRRIFCVGRLDKDSEGLIVLTNDGDLAHKLTHPRFGVPKTYVARVDGKVTGAHLAKLQHGVHLAEGRTQPAYVRIRKRNPSVSVLMITIREGLNREVRRMLAAIGLRCRRLKRVKIGPLALGQMPVGGSRPLTPPEVAVLQRAIDHALRQGEAGVTGTGAPGPHGAEGRADRSAKPFRNRELRPRGPDAGGEARDAGPRDSSPRPWEKRGGDSGGKSGKPWERKSRDEAGARSGKPWERKSRDEAGARSGKPWERKSRDEAGARSGKPWERKSRDEAGARSGKPWERKSRDEMGARSGKPWERKSRDEVGARSGKPWERKGPKDRPRGGESASNDRSGERPRKWHDGTGAKRPEGGAKRESRFGKPPRPEKNPRRSIKFAPPQVELDGSSGETPNPAFKRGKQRGQRSRHDERQGFQQRNKHKKRPDEQP